MLPLIRRHRYDSAIARELDTQTQAEYVARYGDPDVTVLSASDFEPPAGGYFVAHLDDNPVASGAWRRHGDSDAEMKRLFVRSQHRGRGLARAMVAHLEADAAAAGRSRMILETGDSQPEAIALYTSLGYLPVEPFGEYARVPGAHHFGKLLIPADVAAT